MKKPDYQREGVTLYRGDCLDVLPHLDAVDAVVTSPPYNCGKEYGTNGDDLELGEYWNWLESVVSGSVRTLAAHGYLCLNHGNWIGSREGRVFVPDELRPLLDRYLPFRDWIIWNKGPANGAAWGNYPNSPRIRSQHENIFVHGGCSPMPDSDISWADWSRYTCSVWDIPTKGVSADIHPAMMPSGVAHRLIMLYSPHGGTVLDPFAGSGTTGVACIKAGRKFIGIELEQRYFDVAVKRIEKAFDDDALFTQAEAA